ncbi:hypothetical protein GPECTOR_3g238 [Gonium pectorale]|uniref:Uncharacterized protein n=1 Tax=Gonium pectorale TaxID=33097 RepID=A0A150GZD7_GONPE|nr:hypothetical protein GPECTOR_3g238 [Gonium pectorale]|eukprot:KXZ55082.1 hypothetical protein GPECTOR_3g238 [Gonium pectorale]
MQHSSLSVSVPNDADVAQQPDKHANTDDPQRLLKLSHSLRYQLAQPFAGKPATRGGQDWLQREVRHDVDGLRQHVDEYASRRERRAFERERAALQAEIAALRKRLADSEAKVVKLELMLPNENGDFRRLRAELEELEKEADHFSALYEREAAATKAALSGYRQAIADIVEIEQEFELVKRLLAKMGEPVPGFGGVAPPGVGVGPYGGAAPQPGVGAGFGPGGGAVPPYAVGGPDQGASYAVGPDGVGLAPGGGQAGVGVGPMSENPHADMQHLFTGPPILIRRRRICNTRICKMILLLCCIRDAGDEDDKK